MKSVQMFRDEAVIFVVAGNGGDGCSAFHREKYISRGGPSGGDGGDGGDVVLVADANENSLYRINREYHLRAAHGVQGSSNNRSGANGASLHVKVPVGTQIFDFKHGNCLADLCKDGQSLVVASGGKGGRGNARFASAIRQTPRYSEEGRPGESRKLSLELKLVADVGLLGLPNAGKSTLMNTITASKSKVADYPFTTLDPSLGIVDMKDFGSPLVLASGFLFGSYLGTIIVILTLSLGSTLIYIFANFFFKDLIREKFLNKFKNLETRFRNKELTYMILYRFIGGIPMQLQNLIPCMFSVSTKNFFIGSIIGFFPQAFIFSSLGSGLENQIKKNSEPPSFVELVTSFEIYGPILGFFFLLVLVFVVKNLLKKN